jgi:shikimate kinase
MRCATAIGVPDPAPTPVSVALVGFMGAGKSRIGMALAHRLRLPFVDTDAIIVEQLGPIEQIFAERGEAAFRTVEGNVVTAALEEARRTACVVALGGGAVVSAKVRDALAALPHVIWLTASPEVLFSRAADGARPLAAEKAAFVDLLERRQPHYRAVATAVVSNDDNRAVDDVVDELVRMCAVLEAES